MTQLLISCKSAASWQLNGPHAARAAVVPASRKGAVAEFLQKQVWGSSVKEGIQPPCASKRGPHREAQTGSTLVNGTITPSGDGVAARGDVRVTADATDARLPTRKRSDEVRIVAVILVSCREGQGGERLVVTDWSQWTGRVDLSWAVIVVDLSPTVLSHRLLSSRQGKCICTEVQESSATPHSDRGRCGRPLGVSDGPSEERMLVQSTFGGAESQVDLFRFVRYGRYPGGGIQTTTGRKNERRIAQ